MDFSIKTSQIHPIGEDGYHRLLTSMGNHCCSAINAPLQRLSEEQKWLCCVQTTHDSITPLVHWNSRMKGWSRWGTHACTRAGLTFTRHAGRLAPPNGSADLTCPVSFGHQPREAATDFGSGEVVVLERLYCWSNKRLLGVPGVLNFTHISTLNCGSLHPTRQRNGRTLCWGWWGSENKRCKPRRSFFFLSVMKYQTVVRVAQPLRQSYCLPSILPSNWKLASVGRGWKAFTEKKKTTLELREKTQLCP